MPPKKPAAVSDVPPVPSSSDSPPEEKAEKKSGNLSDEAEFTGFVI